MFKFQTERRDGEKVEKSVVLIKDYPPIVVIIGILVVALVLVTVVLKEEILNWL